MVLTRRTDTFVPLERRTAIAVKDNADLFLSIHVNASEDTRARGIETYYLNFAPKVARPANTEMHVAALRAAGARWESQFPRYALAGVGRHFEDCELLVIEVAPKDPLRNVNEADILKRYWTSWATELGMANADKGDFVLFENAPLSAVQERVKSFLTTP